MKSDVESKRQAEQLPGEDEQIVERVKERYAKFAEGGAAVGCCSPTGDKPQKPTEGEVAESIGYRSDDLQCVPEGANLGLGCGAPIQHLQLQPGETVLDLGSGGGLDAFLAAKCVGENGRVIGVDMTPEMIEKARGNAKRAGLDQVEFRYGRLEELPVEDNSVDAVTSNCVINLVPQKSRVFGEIVRVLRPGGRVVISDIVLDGELPEAVRSDLMAYVGCVAGAMQRESYFSKIEEAGLVGVEILQDSDYLGAVENVLPEEVVGLLNRTGVRLADLRGRVRSVTWKARVAV